MDLEDFRRLHQMGDIFSPALQGIKPGESQVLNRLPPAATTMVEISTLKTLTLSADTAHLSNRPLPDAPTGYYDWQITTDTSDDGEGHSVFTNITNRVQAFIAKDPTLPNPKILVSYSLVSIFSGAKTPAGWDPRRPFEPRSRG